MKLLVVLAAAWLAATPAPAATDDDAVKAIGVTLDSFHRAASRADGKAYFPLLAPDSVFIGTDAGERWPLEAFKAYAEPLFAQGHGWTYVPRERHITVAAIPCACVAWFDELLDNAKYGTSRGTGVLTLGPDGWKIAQYVLTFPIPNPLAPDITRMIRDFEAKNAITKN